MIVRDATQADLDAVVDIEAACFPGEAWTRSMLADELVRPGGIFLVLEVGGELTGFVIGWAILEELHVFQVAVWPAARRGGYGRALVHALHARAATSEVAWLEVRRDNVAAIGLYTALGYAVIAERRRYYPDGCDAVIMKRALAG